MIKKLLLTVFVCASASGFLAGKATAMLPVGNDANRRFYKDQEWIWNTQEQPVRSAAQSDNHKVSFTMPTHPPQSGIACRRIRRKAA
jgi:hypothetical protein